MKCYACVGLSGWVHIVITESYEKEEIIYL